MDSLWINIICVAVLLWTRSVLQLLRHVPGAELVQRNTGETPFRRSSSRAIQRSSSGERLLFCALSATLSDIASLSTTHSHFHYHSYFLSHLYSRSRRSAVRSRGRRRSRPVRLASTRSHFSTSRCSLVGATIS